MALLEAVTAVTAACKALELAAGAASNVESLGEFIGRLGSAEYDLQSEKVKKGRSALSEADAAQIVMAEERARRMRENLYNVFLQTNRLDLYQDIEKHVREARVERKKEMQRAAAQRAANIKAIKEAVLIGCIAIFLAPPAIYTVVQLIIL